MQMIKILALMVGQMTRILMRIISCYSSPCLPPKVVRSIALQCNDGNDDDEDRCRVAKYQFFYKECNSGKMKSILAMIKFPGKSPRPRVHQRQDKRVVLFFCDCVISVITNHEFVIGNVFVAHSPHFRQICKNQE